MIDLSPVSLDQIAKLKTSLESEGSTVTSLVEGSYKIVDEKRGVEAVAILKGENLNVVVTKKPHFIPQSFVEAQVKDGLEKALKG
jgi:hypothetical protein